MVDTNLENSQWSLLDSVSQLSADIKRCIQERMGSSLSRDINWVPIVKRGTVLTYICVEKVALLTFNK